MTVCCEHEARRNAMSLRGFTIIELMMAIALIAIVASLAAPSFLSTIRANRTVTANNELISAMALARSEAIKRGTRVTACPTADQATCAAAGGWEQGWMVFVDATTAGTVDVGDVVLRVWDPIVNGTTIRAAGSFSNFVSFVASGEARATPNNFDSFYVCDSEGDAANGRTINVAALGYAKTEKGAVACP